jgi:hypothetical protein
MKKAFIIILSLVSAFSFAQNSIESDQWYSKDNSDSKVSYNADVKYNVNVGTSISSFGRDLSGYNYYVAPSASIPISKKTTLTVGFIMNQTQYSGLMMGEGGMQNKTISHTQAIVYASGSHQINPNITVFASGYYDMNSRNNPSGVASNPYSPYGSEGFSLGAEFKIGEKTRIGIHVQYDKGGNPYMNPYGVGGMGNYGSMGMGNSPFGMY